MKNILKCTMVLWILIVGISQSKVTITAEPVRIIFDTDMDTDCDDAGALAMLHNLADLGECEILATVVSAHYPFSAPCVEAVNRYYGRPDLPIGVPKLPGASTNRGSRYAKQIAERYETTLQTNEDAADAVDVYRRILSESPDKSVVICSVGYLTNLRYLLESEPDGISPMSGRELIEQKVKVWVCMGGRYPQHLDPKVYGNFKPDPEASVIAATQWTGQIVFTGLGNDILTGECLRELEEENPARVAYELYLGDKPARPSWDPIAVLYSVRPELEFWKLHQEGKNHIFDNGTNEWRDGEAENHVLLQLQTDSKQELENMLEELMCVPRR